MRMRGIANLNSQPAKCVWQGAASILIGAWKHGLPGGRGSSQFCLRPNCATLRHGSKTRCGVTV